MHVNTASELLYILAGYAYEHGIVYLPKYGKDNLLKGLTFTDEFTGKIVISFEDASFINVKSCGTTMTFRLGCVDFDLKLFECDGKMELQFTMSYVNVVSIMLYDYEE